MAAHAKSSRMRTAEDVIKRLEWDTVDDAVHGFSVGYLDRFLGIMEEPFESRDGMWREVPQHRIAWFKYGGTVIWEKESRTDYVFGTANGRGKRLPAVVAEVNAALAAAADGPAAGAARSGAEHAGEASQDAGATRAVDGSDETSAATSDEGAPGAAADAEADEGARADDAAVEDSFEWTDTSWADDSWA